jgi:hypothetical protein
MALLGKGDISPKRGKRRYETVSVPEWGGDVRIQSLMVGEAGAVEEYVHDEKNPHNNGHFRAMLCVTGLVDADGTPLYSIDDADDFLELEQAPVRRIADAVFKLSGMAAEERKATEKNSESGQTDASS